MLTLVHFQNLKWAAKSNMLICLKIVLHDAETGQQITKSTFFVPKRFLTPGREFTNHICVKCGLYCFCNRYIWRFHGHEIVTQAKKKTATAIKSLFCFSTLQNIKFESITYFSQQVRNDLVMYDLSERRTNTAETYVKGYVFCFFNSCQKCF